MLLSLLGNFKLLVSCHIRFAVKLTELSDHYFIKKTNILILCTLDCHSFLHQSKQSKIQKISYSSNKTKIVLKKVNEKNDDTKGVKK